MTGWWRRLFASATGRRGPEKVPTERHPVQKRTHNLFEAAAVYVAARAEDDEEHIAEAAGWVSPEALSFGVSELACRAVLVLASERGQHPQTVARDLLELPAG